MTRTTEAKDNRRGIPQGSPISPLLANLYMRRFVLGWKKRGFEQRLGTRIVTYADDLVILCRTGKAEEALQRLREIMGDAAHAILTRPARECTGNLFIDDDVLRAEGVSDFARYRYPGVREEDLLPDFFV